MGTYLPQTTVRQKQSWNTELTILVLSSSRSTTPSCALSSETQKQKTLMGKENFKLIKKNAKNLDGMQLKSKCTAWKGK